MAGLPPQPRGHNQTLCLPHPLRPPPLPSPRSRPTPPRYLLRVPPLSLPSPPAASSFFLFSSFFFSFFLFFSSFLFSFFLLVLSCSDEFVASSLEESAAVWEAG